MHSAKPKALVFIFEGLADWEPALALCEIRKSGKYDVLTVGRSRQTVTTMAGLRVTPDLKMDEIEPDEGAIFIVPGGNPWEDGPDEKLEELLKQLHAEKILIGAVCGATLEIARAGLTAGIRHTSNAKSYLKKMVPEYADENSYVEDLAVTDQNIITASGLGSVEFAREVIHELNLYNESDALIWFEMFKHGVIPPNLL
ncbi:MAG: DJ-1/PfpI family protein [Candidatus Sulfotelmatobacter sp.]|jgi:putative intracellular protease/amidase